MKKVLNACIDQVLQFDNVNEYDTYIKELNSKRIKFKIESTNSKSKKVIVRIRKQYNKNKFIIERNDDNE